MQRYELFPKLPKKVSTTALLAGPQQAHFFGISSVFLRYFFGEWPKKHRRNTEEQLKNRATHTIPIAPRRPSCRECIFSKEKKCHWQLHLLTELCTPSNNKTQSQRVRKDTAKNRFWFSNVCRNTLQNKALKTFSTYKALIFKRLSTYQQMSPHRAVFLKKIFKHQEKIRILKALLEC